MDASLTSSRFGSARTATIVAIVFLVGFMAWKFMRPLPPATDARVALSNRTFELMGQFAVVPDATSGRMSGEPTGIRVQPGGELRFDVARIGGLLHGRYQAADPKVGTIIELQAIDGQGRRQSIIRRVLLSSDRVPSDGVPMYFLMDPGALPAGTQGLVLAVPADAPAAADWNQVDVVARAASPALRRLPLPLQAYEGFQELFINEQAILAHAPMQFVLSVPAGHYAFSASFGYNPAALTQADGRPDGMEFRFILENAHDAQTLLTRPLDPVNRPEDGVLQQANLTLNSAEPARLRLVVTSGPNGVLNWDWLMWVDLRATPVAASQP